MPKTNVWDIESEDTWQVTESVIAQRKQQQVEAQRQQILAALKQIQFPPEPPVEPPPEPPTPPTPVLPYDEYMAQQQGTEEPPLSPSYDEFMAQYQEAARYEKPPVPVPPPPPPPERMMPGGLEGLPGYEPPYKAVRTPLDELLATLDIRNLPAAYEEFTAAARAREPAPITAVVEPVERFLESPTGQAVLTATMAIPAFAGVIPKLGGIAGQLTKGVKTTEEALNILKTAKEGFIAEGKIAQASKIDDAISQLTKAAPKAVEVTKPIVPEAAIPKAEVVAPAEVVTAKPVVSYDEAVAAKKLPTEGAPPQVPPIKPPIAEAAPELPPDDVIKQFTQFIHSPESIDLTTLTQKALAQQRATRIAAYDDIFQKTLSQGRSIEEADKEARQALAGKYERPISNWADALTEQTREALFAKVNEVMPEGFEKVSTLEALRNALLGHGIPTTPGIKGGSAYSRLSKVFPPEVVETLSKTTPLRQQVEEILLSRPPRPPTRIEYPPTTAIPSQLPLKPPPPLVAPQYAQTEIERKLAVSDFRQEIEAMQAGRPYPPPNVERFESVIDNVIKQPSMWPLSTQNVLVRVLKGGGWAAIDIGNALRAVKSGLDLSFWRQQALLIPMNFTKTLKATVSGWRAGWDPKFAKAAFENIQKHPYYRYYEAAGKDFLRPLEQKGISDWQKTEQFMILGSERLIPRIMEKVPGLGWSQRAFVTGANQMNWEIFADFVDKVLAKNAAIAAGKTTMKAGEAFNMQQTITNFAGMLADMTGRAGLGPLKALTPAINAGFYSMRLTLGRILTPRHLFSSDPMVRKEAWKNILGAITTYGGIILLGKQLGLWDVSLDSNSPDYGIIRLGPIRLDPWGGYQQYVVLLSRTISQSATSATTGINRPSDLGNTLSRFLFSKESPGAGLGIETWTQKTFLGEDVDYSNLKQWADRIAPMSAVDMVETLAETGVAGLFVAPAAAVGWTKGAYAYPKQDEVAKQLYGKPYADLDVPGRMKVNAQPEILELEEQPRFYTNEEVRQFKEVVSETQNTFALLPIEEQLKVTLSPGDDSIRNVQLSNGERMKYQKASLIEMIPRIISLITSTSYQQATPGLRKEAIQRKMEQSREVAAGRILQQIGMPEQQRRAAQ